MPDTLETHTACKTQTPIPNLTPPGMEMPGTFDEHLTTETGNSGNKSMRRTHSAPRLLIIAGTLIIALMGIIFAALSNSWMQSAGVSVLVITIWLTASWWIRNLPISAKSRELDAQLNDARLKAEAANQAKTRFLAIASHEMRTPLNGILGMSKLMEDTDLSLEQQNYNLAIKNSGEGLFSFIEDMLDITRIETGHFTLNPQPVNIRTHMENICELLSQRGYEKNLEIATITAADLPQQIAIDKKRLQQVLVNLLGNAIKFTSHGGITLRAEKYAAADGNTFLQFTVTDTGPGIHDRDKIRIFREFEQADIEITRKFGGAGLGLAISKAIVEQMKGSISIFDNHPNGAKFVVKIPMPKPVQNPYNKPKTTTVPKGGKVLLLSQKAVEDTILAEMIGHFGYEVELASDFVTAMKSINQDNIHAVIVDDLLVEHNIELIKNHASKIKFIVMLQPAGRKNLDALQVTGFSSYLIRPIRHDTLQLVLNGLPDFGAKKLLEKYQGSTNGEPSIGENNCPAQKILLVEDNAINSLLARRALEKTGHNVELAQNGKIAISMFENAIAACQPYDLVYMDLHMPVMDGLTAITMIRKIEENSNIASVRIIVLSADEQESAREEVDRAGASGFLSKPIDPVKLAIDANTKSI